MGMATVHVELTMADLRAAGRARPFRTHGTGVAIALGIVAVGFVVGVLTTPGWGLLALVATYIAFMIYVVICRRRLSRPAARARRALTIAVGEEGFSAVTTEATVNGAWTMLRNAKLTKDHLFLRFRSGKIICIPRRCFASSEAESAFLDVVAAHLRVKGLDASALAPVTPA